MVVGFVRDLDRVKVGAVDKHLLVSDSLTCRELGTLHFGLDTKLELHAEPAQTIQLNFHHQSVLVRKAENGPPG